MKAPRKLLFIPILVIGIAWLWSTFTQPGETVSGFLPAALPGSQAPDFTLRTLDGEIVTLSGLRGRPVLVNMWASWCTPCKYEMPAIQKVYEEFSGQGFVVLAVNLTKKDNLTAVASFVEEYGLTFPVLLDVDGQVEKAYQLRGLPSSFFIDGDGIIQSVVIGGPMSDDVVRTGVEKLLDE